MRFEGISKMPSIRTWNRFESTMSRCRRLDHPQTLWKRRERNIEAERETVPDTKQSFGEQAARFSLYSPLVVLILGIVNITKADRSVSIAIFAINLLLIISALILGVIALISMRRYGRKRILSRALDRRAVNGQWALVWDQLQIKATRVDGGDASMVGQTMALGTVKSLDDQRLVIATGKGEEIYHRVP